ncbi:MAG: hypothetical protein M1837_001437 [Sclerophora amabilis]|nr:MAG: hypothetical protein M1837_001437 [Sclerophora amabilis]
MNTRLRSTLLSAVVVTVVTASPLGPSVVITRPSPPPLVVRQANLDCSAPEWRPSPENWKSVDTNPWLQNWWACLSGPKESCVSSTSSIISATPTIDPNPPSTAPVATSTQMTIADLDERLARLFANSGRSANSTSEVDSSRTKTDPSSRGRIGSCRRKRSDRRNGSGSLDGSSSQPASISTPVTAKDTSQKAVSNSLAERATTDDLTLALREKYAPKVDGFACSVQYVPTPLFLVVLNPELTFPSSQCTIASCDDIAVTEPDAQKGYWTLMSIANFNNHMKFFYDSVTRVQTQQNSRGAGFAKTFTEAGHPATDGGKMLQSILNAVLIVVGLALIAFLPEIALVMGAAAVMAPLLNGLSKTGGILTGITGAVGFSKLDVTTTTINELANLGDFTAALSDHTRRSLEADNKALLAGMPDSGGKHIWDYLADGKYSQPPPDPSDDMDKFLTSQYDSGALNAVWKYDRVFIMGYPRLYPGPNSYLGKGCAEYEKGDETKGPSETYLCTGDDQYVYYAYRLPSADKAFRYPRLQLPLGLDALKDYNLDIHTIMKSSIAAYKADRTMNYDNVRSERWGHSMDDGSKDNPILSGPSFEGTFTIPVCIATGLMTAVVNDRIANNYPCECGGDVMEGNRGNETEAFRAATGLKDFEPYMKWCGRKRPYSEIILPEIAPRNDT